MEYLCRPPRSGFLMSWTTDLLTWPPLFTQGIKPGSIVYEPSAALLVLCLARRLQTTNEVPQIPSLHLFDPKYPEPQR